MPRLSLPTGSVTRRLWVWWNDRTDWVKRVVIAVLGVIIFIAVLTVLYHALMTRVEGASPPPSHSVQVVVETVTGTGYGSDAPWSTPLANAYVTLMDLSTFLVLFIVVPYVLQPVLETALSPTLPATVDAEDQVVVCGTPALTNRLIDELERREIPVVVVTEDEAAALDIHDDNDGGPAIHGSPTNADTLRRAGVDRARAVVVDTGDERAAGVVLAAREVDPAIRTVAVVDHCDHEAQLQHAGADSVLTPRQLLGRRIAERVSRSFDPGRSDVVELAAGLSLLEMTVAPESPPAGHEIGDIAGDELTIVGRWVDGDFVGSPAADAVVDTGSVLLVAGDREALSRLEADGCRREPDPTVIVAGHGIVGATVRESLDDEGIDSRVIDIEDGPAVDVVGDATAAETLREAGIDEAAAVVVALDDDDATVLSTLAADAAGGTADVIARMNDAATETNIRRAGADYVLGVSTISGRLLAGEILQEPTICVDRQLRTARLSGDRFVGQRIGETVITDTDCVVVGVDRDDKIRSDIDDSFEVRASDNLFVVGPDADIDRLS